jgi:hypothetical protein
MTSFDMDQSRIRNHLAATVSAADKHLDALCSALGYDGTELSEKLLEKISQIATCGVSHISLELILTDTPVLSWNKTGIFGKEMIVKSRKWASVTGQSEGQKIMHCFVLTLGNPFEILAEETGKMKLFDYHVLDNLGSLLAEKAADELESMIRKSLDRKGRDLSRRFSPGYCDWDLAQGQKTLSTVLDPKRIGVTFLPGGAMRPAKTVSGVFLSANRIPFHSPCPLCDDKTCRHRRSLSTISSRPHIAD